MFKQVAEIKLEDKRFYGEITEALEDKGFEYYAILGTDYDIIKIFADKGENE